MVSIIIEQMKERENRLSKIGNSLRANPDRDIKDAILEVAAIWCCSQRKASEYVRIAKWRIENEDN